MPSYKFFLIIIMTISTSISAWEEGFVYNDDVKIAYRDYGPIEGEPVLLVQGLGGQLINWPDHLIDFLILCLYFLLKLVFCLLVVHLEYAVS